MWAVAAAAVIAALAAAAGLPARATYGARTTADEPQYLLTAISVAEDGDLDIGDELAAQRWRIFHEAELPQQTRPLPDGRRVSPHDPLLPLLLAPGMAVAGWAGAKLVLVVVAATTAGLLVWVAVRRLAVRPTVAGFVVAVLCASVPLAPYGAQVYPELPAALAVLVAVAALLGPLRAAGTLAATTACVALPWLGVKYAPVTAVVVVLVASRLVRARRARTAVAFLAALAAAGIAYLAVHQAVWTGWTAYASADHFVDSGETGVIGFTPDYAGRGLRLSGLLLDRAFGIAAWQPAWLVTVPALAALLRARPPHWQVVVAPLAVGWFVATFVALTMAGWWFPGRQIVVVVPLLVFVTAWWVDGRPVALAVFAVAGLVGVANWLMLAVEAWRGRLTLVVDFFDTANPLYQGWAAVLPDYMDTGTIPWGAHSAWLLVLAGLTVIGWRTAGGLQSRPAAGGCQVSSAASADDAQEAGSWR